MTPLLRHIVRSVGVVFTKGQFRSIHLHQSAQPVIKPPPPKLILENLKSRGLIRVQGRDVTNFLQGLVTNDIRHLQEGANGIYGLFLNKSGRVLYDTIIYRTAEDDTYLIECDKMVLTDLKKHLMLYRVRKKISIDSVNPDYSIWVAFNPHISKIMTEDYKLPEEGAVIVPKPRTSDGSKRSDENVDEVLLCQDPRMKYLGTRIIAPRNYVISDVSKILPNYEFNTEPTRAYKSFRYQLGVGEGVNELPPAKCFPMETNGDYLQGISFSKGCYIGQELTARTHHTGVIRKRLMPIYLQRSVDGAESKEVLSPAGDKVGLLRGVEESCGLGLLRIEKALDARSLRIGEAVGKTLRPVWWPQADTSRQTKLNPDKEYERYRAEVGRRFSFN